MRTLAIWSVPALLLAAASTANHPRISAAQDRCPDNQAWVQNSLEKMETIQPGMTRAQLLAVFRSEGGLSSRLHRTYVSQDCPYFKVDVEFQTAENPERDAEGRIVGDEAPTDVITKISRPYLQFAVAD